MVVRIPGPEFYPPKPAPDPVEEERTRRTQEKLDRYQARDDAMFITSSLARLTARQEQAFEDASSEAFRLETLGPAPAFARRMAGAFDEDVNAVIAEAEGREGVKPSPDALDLFRRRAGVEREKLFARGAIQEDKLHRMSLLEATAGSLNALGGMVSAQPETLDRALTQLDGVIAAYGTLAGPEAAENMRAEQPVRLAQSALDGMVRRDPEEALLALDAGQFNDRIDEVTRARMKDRATRRKETLALDTEENTRRDAALAVQETERKSFAFRSGFRRRIEAGEATLTELTDAEVDGIITSAQMVGLRDKFDAGHRQWEKEQAGVQRITDILAGDGLPDPMDDQDRIDVDHHCKAVIDPDADIQPQIMPYVEETGIAPKSMVDKDSRSAGGRCR